MARGQRQQGYRGSGWNERGRYDDRYGRREPDRGGSASRDEDVERGFTSDQVYGRDYRRAREYSDNEPRHYGGYEYGGNDEPDRDRGDGAGISGQYWTRDPYAPGSPRNDALDGRYDAQRREREPSQWQRSERERYERSYGAGNHGEYADESTYRSPFHSRPDSDYSTDRRVFGAGGLQQGGFPIVETQSHYGRGPKGYTRSDERIREDVNERLYQDHDVDASEISVSVLNGEVTLGGTVDTRRMKHRAEDIADSVTGVRDVHNQLRVARGVMNQLAEKVHHGVEKLTGSENRTTPTASSANNRHSS